MNSEKVKEIKKALENCSNPYGTDCYHCPYLEKGCNIKLMEHALTLINELESENEILRNAKVVYETVDYCYEDLKKAEKRIAELEKVYDRQVRIINDLNIEVVKNQEKLPKFAKRLKDRLRYTSPTSDVLELSGLVFDGIEVEQSIDETLKEFEK